MHVHAYGGERSSCTVYVPSFAAVSSGFLRYSVLNIIAILDDTGVLKWSGSNACTY